MPGEAGTLAIVCWAGGMFFPLYRRKIASLLEMHLPMYLHNLFPTTTKKLTQWHNWKKIIGVH